MFKQKTIIVNIGDVFVERIHRRPRIERLLGLRPKIDGQSFGNQWRIISLQDVNGLPHAQIQTKSQDDGVTLTRLIAISALETEQNYQRILEA